MRLGGIFQFCIMGAVLNPLDSFFNTEVHRGTQREGSKILVRIYSQDRGISRKTMTSKLYDLDFYAWTLEQSKLLQEGKWQSLDITNLVEEIESLGKQQRQELRNRLGILIGHLLKWEYQPEMQSKSWRATIREQRKEVLRLLKENPSLKSYLTEKRAASPWL